MKFSHYCLFCLELVCLTLWCASVGKSCPSLLFGIVQMFNISLCNFPYWRDPRKVCAYSFMGLLHDIELPQKNRQQQPSVCPAIVARSRHSENNKTLEISQKTIKVKRKPLISPALCFTEITAQLVSQPVSQSYLHFHMPVKL